MKMIKTGLLIVMLTLTNFIATAQESTDTYVPKWVSEKGYWVVEGNVNTPLENTIRFYNNEDVLVYQENLSGVKLNTSKRKVKIKLKQVLETAVTAWESKREKTGEIALVKNIL